MIDLNLLRLLKHRGDFYRVKGRIPDSALDPQTRTILKDFGTYFERFPDHTVVDMDNFLPMFRSWHPTLKDEQRNQYEGLFTRAKEDVSQDVRHEVMRTVLELRLATEMANLVEKFDAGDLPNIHQAIAERITEFKADSGLKDVQWIQDDIDDLLNEDNNHVGITFRLDAVNQSMRPLKGGDFGIIAGRPDRGKTTLISSEVTYMAAQLPPEKNILWLNNEGMGKRIIPRLYQSLFGATKSQLITLSQRGVLKKAYKERLGRMDKIRVIDIHGMDNFTVEQIIESNNPGVVVYDMIDNIRGFGDAARTDLGLEKMYQWAREISVKYDLVGLATSQISADGDGMFFPTQSMLKDSKTGKQGACDFIMMIGASNDPAYANQRAISLPKNKLRIDGGPADPRAIVSYEPMRARYEDMDITEPVPDDDSDDKEGSE